MAGSRSDETALRALGVLKEYADAFAGDKRPSVDAFKRAARKARDLTDSGSFSPEVRRLLNAVADAFGDVYLACLETLAPVYASRLSALAVVVKECIVVALYLIVLFCTLVVDYRSVVGIAVVALVEYVVLKDLTVVKAVCALVGLARRG